MSVNDLLKGIKLDPQMPYVQPPERKGQIENSEGLRDMKETIAGSLDNRRKLQSRYYADQSIVKGKPKNVSGLSIRDIQQQKYYKPKEWAERLEGAIDPNKIRSVEQPENALPRNETIGNDGGYYELDEDDFRAFDNNEILRKAMESYSRARGGMTLSGFIYPTKPSQGDIPANFNPPKP